jgi:hypothetical protein
MNHLFKMFTQDELAELREIYYSKRKYIDRELIRTTVSCDPLSYTLGIYSPYSGIIIEALQFLGIVDQTGYPYSWYFENGYFNIGPQDGARHKPSWTNNTDIYTTLAGWELIKYIDEIFIGRTSFHLQTYKQHR